MMSSTFQKCSSSFCNFSVMLLTCCSYDWKISFNKLIWFLKLGCQFSTKVYYRNKVLFFMKVTLFLIINLSRKNEQRTIYLISLFLFFKSYEHWEMFAWHFLVMLSTCWWYDLKTITFSKTCRLCFSIHRLCLRNTFPAEEKRCLILILDCCWDLFAVELL